LQSNDLEVIETVDVTSRFHSFTPSTQAMGSVRFGAESGKRSLARQSVGI